MSPPARAAAATVTRAQRWTPESLWIECGEEETPLARRLRARLPGVRTQVIADPLAAEPAGPAARFALGKRRLVVRRHRGTFLHHCPAGTAGLVCCNYLVANFAANCPFDCSYCFLQEYLANNPALKVYTNVVDGLAEIDAVLQAHPGRSFRIGTGELADSLALDHLTDLSRELVPFAAQRPNLLLELKTKSDCIDNLLDLDPRDRVVVSWSVNAPPICAAEEAGTVSLVRRNAAAVRVQAAGYKVGLHFDPLIAYDGWETGYRDAIGLVFRGLDPRRVAWVSLGGLRLTPPLKAAMKTRHPGSAALGSELVPAADGKERVWRGLRVKMYRRMVEWLAEVDARMPVYVCMESAAVWERLFAAVPSDRELGQRLSAGPQ